MAAYATVADIEARYRELSTDEETVVTALIGDAAVMIDSYNAQADAEAKELVTIRMVLREISAAMGGDIPIGSTQGSISALGYSQSWTVGNGAVGELYLGKEDKHLLGVMGGRLGSYSPTEELRCT